VSRPVWGSPSLLPSRYEGLYPWGWSWPLTSI
jgi:hypothetical protein